MVARSDRLEARMKYRDAPGYLADCFELLHRGSVFVSSRRVPRKGTHVRVTLEAEGREPVVFEGRVVARQRFGNEQNLPPGFRVKAEPLDETTRARLQAAVTELRHALRAQGAHAVPTVFGSDACPV